MIFWQPSAVPSFPSLGRVDHWLPKGLGREKVNSLLPCPPVRAVGLAVWPTRWMVVAHGAFHLCTQWGENLPSSPTCSFLHGISGQSGSEGTNRSLGILAKCYVIYKICPPCMPSSSPELGRDVQPAPCLCHIAAGCKARRTLATGDIVTLQGSLLSPGPRLPAAPLQAGLGSAGLEGLNSLTQVSS